MPRVSATTRIPARSSSASGAGRSRHAVRGDERLHPNPTSAEFRPSSGTVRRRRSAAVCRASGTSPTSSQLGRGRCQERGSARPAGRWSSRSSSSSTGSRVRTSASDESCTRPSTPQGPEVPPSPASRGQEPRRLPAGGRAVRAPGGRTRDHVLVSRRAEAMPDAAPPLRSRPGDTRDRWRLARPLIVRTGWRTRSALLSRNAAGSPATAKGTARQAAGTVVEQPFVALACQPWPTGTVPAAPPGDRTPGFPELRHVPAPASGCESVPQRGSWPRRPARACGRESPAPRTGRGRVAVGRVSREPATGPGLVPAGFRVARWCWNVGILESPEGSSTAPFPATAAGW